MDHHVPQEPFNPIILISFCLIHYSVFYQMLKRARELGDFLLVGIHSDETVRYTDFYHVDFMCILLVFMPTINEKLTNFLQ